RGLVEAPRLGLDARPFDREAVSVEIELLDQLEIVVETIPGAARVAGALPALFDLPVPKSRTIVAALDLVGGRRDAPQKGLREIHAVRLWNILRNVIIRSSCRRKKS